MEREALDVGLRRAMGGRRTTISIRGEAGIGKSSLLEELIGRAHDAGGRCVRMSVSEVESEIGFVGLATLLNGVGPDDLALLHPYHRDALAAARGITPADAIDPLSIAAALAELLRRLTADGVVVVVVDDAHWLDRSTAGALSFAMRILVEVPLLVAVASRPTPILLDPVRLVGPDDLIVIEPTPLSIAGVREMLVAADLHLERIDLVRVAEATAGNPLHVVETMRMLRSGTPVAEALVPASLRDAVDAAVAPLDPTSLQVLAAASLMVDPQVRLLRQVMSAPGATGPLAAAAPDVDRALAEAERLDLASSRGGVIRFRHPLVRDRLAERLTPTERRLLHRRFAELDLPLAIRARHLSEAAEGVDHDVAALLDDAVDDARARGALDEALGHALSALQLTAPGDTDALGRRRLRAAEVALDAGDPRQAHQLIETDLAALLAGTWPDSPDSDPIQLLSVGVLAIAGVLGTSAALPVMERLVASVEPEDPRRATACGWVVRAHLFTGVHTAIERAEALLREARSDGSSAVITVLEAASRTARALAGEPLGRPGLDADELDDLDELPWAVLEDLLATAVWTDDHVRAEQLVARARQRLERSPSIHHQQNALMHEGDLRCRQGRLTDAADLFERAAHLAVAMEDGGARAAELALVLAVGGRVEEALTWLAGSGDALRDAAPIVQGQARFVHGVVARFAGRPEQAVDDLRRSRRLLDAVGVRDLGALPVHGELVDALVATGALDEAVATVDEMAELAERSGRERGTAELARARAAVLAARGSLDDAALAAADAMQRYERLGMPIEAARAELLLGSVERRRRHRTLARHHLESARSTLTACGAHGLASRVDAELERLGARSGDAQTLTPTEAQIADLVAAGRTNDEVAATLFVSRRTVEANLTRIYRKLGVRSRSELAARSRPA